MIRRGGVTDVPWFLARLKIKCLESIQSFTRCNYCSVISPLRVLASHKTNFESVAQRRLGIRHVAIWEVPFLRDPCVFGLSSKKKCL